MKLPKDVYLSKQRRVGGGLVSTIGPGSDAPQGAMIPSDVHGDHERWYGAHRIERDGKWVYERVEGQGDGFETVGEVVAFLLRRGLIVRELAPDDDVLRGWGGLRGYYACLREKTVGAK